MLVNWLSEVRAEQNVQLGALYEERARQAELRSVNQVTSLSEAQFLLDLFGGVMTDAGVSVNSHTAFGVMAFTSCCLLISGRLAALPAYPYERTFLANGRPVKRIAYDDDYYTLLVEEPNDEMSAYTFWRSMILRMLAWEAGIAELQWNAAGYCVGLWPRDPDRTTLRRLTAPLVLEPEPYRPWPVALAAGELVAETTDGQGVSDKAEDGRRRIIPMRDLLYIPGQSFDGRIGKTIVELGRRTLGLALAAEKFGSKYFANFARPGGMLIVPQQRPEDRDKTREQVVAALSGENQNRLLVVGQGTEYKQITNNPTDAQAIETRTAVRAEIAGAFQIAPRFIGDTTKNSRATTEQDFIELWTLALEPRATAIAQEVRRKLYPSRVGVRGRRSSRYFFAYDPWALLRPDAASREKYYASGRQNTYLSPNDVREREGLNPIDEDWAEEYHLQVNMTLASTPVDPNRNKPEPGPVAAGDTPPSWEDAPAPAEEEDAEDKE